MDGTCSSAPAPQGGCRFLLTCRSSRRNLDKTLSYLHFAGQALCHPSWPKSAGAFFCPFCPSSFINLTFWHALNLTVVTLVGVRTLVALRRGWGPAARRPSRCHYSREAEAQTQRWVAWMSCLLRNPRLITVYSQGHQQLRYNTTSVGNWGGDPWTSGIFCCWRKKWHVYVLRLVSFPVGNVKTVPTCSLKRMLSFHAAGCSVAQKHPLGTWDAPSSGYHLVYWSQSVCLEWSLLEVTTHALAVFPRELFSARVQPHLGISGGAGAGAGWRASSVLLCVGSIDLPRRSMKKSRCCLSEQPESYLFSKAWPKPAFCGLRITKS